jgi:hypothetical protein
MINRLKYSLVILLLLGLTACSGSGTKNYSAISQQIQTGETGKIFVSRDKNFAGSAALYQVSINGVSAGELGIGEVVSTNMQPGSNFLQIDVAGILGVGISPAQEQFENTDDKNRFFIAGLKMGLFSSDLSLIETSESSFRKNLN